MCTSAGGNLSERFDARIISLYSRGVQDGIPQNLNGTHVFYSFCYYDAIQISKVDLGRETILRSAYSQAQEGGARLEKLGFQQFLVAAVDILPEPLADCPIGHGYTSDQIENFWNTSENVPLFFVSMINLKESKDLQDVLSNIRAKFPVNEGHLAYLTFDHCDIILFSYGTNFCDYTQKIFKLYYGCEKILDDVITLYGFVPNRTLLDSVQEEFRALIRIGVRDFPMASAFQKKVEELDPPVKCNWLLGRNDISVLCETATLAWLADVRQALIDVEQSAPEKASWYTTYDLMVFSPDQSSETGNNWTSYGSLVNCKNLHDRIMKEFQTFQEKYHQTYHNLKTKHNLCLTPDDVWLRWLQESCRLATSLMGSRLSIDLATCLIPQLLDLLQYATEFFSSGNIQNREEIDKIHESFSIFFSNVAVLVDSMNQTNRQFVQVPAFHLPSFNIPPQILAYYTVLIQRIREILQDDEKTIYGMALSPKLTNILSVSSLAVQHVLPEHQWISISMDETSFYSIKTTTETLAHEISHFIGQDNRNREKRKSCILKCAFQLIFWDILQKLYTLINQKYSRYSSQKNQLTCPTFELEELEEIADRLWKESIRTCGSQYDTSQNLFSKDLTDIVENIPSDIVCTPQLAESFFKEICGLIHNYPKKFENIMNVLRDSFCYLNKSSKNNLLEDEHFHKIIEERLRGLFSHAITDLNTEFNMVENIAESDVDICRMIGNLCYIFRETFADLQAILLLNMKWADYCELMRRPSKSDQEWELICDSPLRMLAVAKTLVESGKWESALDDCGPLFENIQKSVGLRISLNTKRLAEENFNPSMLYYLVEYLVVCKKKIEDNFCSNKEIDARVKALQHRYTGLSNATSFIDLQEALLTFIEKYRDDLLNHAVNSNTAEKEVPCSSAAV